MNQYPAHFHDWPELMTSQDVADVLGCHRATAIRLMKEEGFPLLFPGARRNMRVNKYRFLTWLRGGEK